MVVYTLLYQMDYQQGPIVVHGTLLNIMWMGGELGENGYMYMHA